MFALYERRQGAQESWFKFAQQVTLSGVICDFIDEEAQRKKPDPGAKMAWEISGKDLLDRVLQRNVRSPGDLSRWILIIDAMPRNAGPNLPTQLFCVCHIWGYSDPGWTPILLRLRLVFEDDRESVEETRFEGNLPCHNTGLGEYVYEFLYLRRGHREGRKTWGRVGVTNGALLWPEHMNHLLQQIGYARVGP